MNTRELNKLMVPDVEAAVEDAVGDLPRLVPFKAAAERLSVSVTTLRRWVRKRRLCVVKTACGAAGRVLVPRTEIARLIRLQMI